jgi:arylsulfatase A-like enzyme
MNKFITAFGIAAHIGLSVAQLTAQTKKPNVLLIAVDDLKPVLGCYGARMIRTPNIDRLAKRGTVFTQSYCQQAVCGPTRASLLTGLRPDHTKVWDLKTRMREANPAVVSLPQYLMGNGYSTQGIGKIYDPRCVDDKLDSLSWSVPYYKNSDKYISEAAGTPELGYQLPETKEAIRAYRVEAERKGLQGSAVTDYIQKFIRPTVECIDVPDNAYIDGANALYAKDLLAQLSKDDAPFFFAVGFSKPHLPFVAPKKYWDLYRRDAMPLAPFRQKAKNSPDLAYHRASELYAYSDIPSIASFSDGKGGGLDIPLEKQKELIHGYYASVSYTDAQIGILLDALDSLGLSKNTIVVLWGDHGWNLGDHNLWCKHTNFEQAARAPLLISAPWIKRSVSNSMTEFIDIYPTICELAGVPVPASIDGNSLVPAMKDPKRKVKEFAVSQYPRTANATETTRLGYSAGDFMGYSIRTERFRYTVWMKDKYRSTGRYSDSLVVARELYDYVNDPNETMNVADSPNYSGISKQLNGTMISFFKSQELQ